MVHRWPLGIALVVTLLAGCGRDGDADVEASTPEPVTLPGVYAGEWPCSNCAGIAATLWLRPDGAFFLRQRFTDAEPAPAAADATYGLGRWHWDEQTAEAVLRGPGPERRLALVDANRFELRIASPLEHALVRVDAAPPFGDRITLDGESAVADRGATFRECLTGLTFAVADAGAYGELRRQHRRLNPRGRVALTTVEGHLVTTAEDPTAAERLVIDRFVALKPGTGC